MTDYSRIQELRRRVENDPASIAFAQLAEEHRRLGKLDEAVRVARAGLEHHPAYHSARVTLGRALKELGRLDEAQAEFERVLAAAPDNLMALRSLADLRERRKLPAIDILPLPRLIEPEPATPVLAQDVARSREASGTPESKSLAALESWLAAILADRAARASGRA